MVGIKTWTDEQILLILNRKAAGLQVTEIVEEINQIWPRKNAKDTGVRYVLTNYKDGIPPEPVAGGGKGNRDQTKPNPKRTKRKVTAPPKIKCRASFPPENGLAAQMRDVSGGPILASLLRPQPLNVLQDGVQSTSGLLAHARRAKEIGIYNIQRGATVTPPADPPKAYFEPERLSNVPAESQFPNQFDQYNMNGSSSMPMYGHDPQGMGQFGTNGFYGGPGDMYQACMTMHGQQYSPMGMMQGAPSAQEFGGYNTFAQGNGQHVGVQHQHFGGIDQHGMPMNQQAHGMAQIQAQPSVNHQHSHVQVNGQHGDFQPQVPGGMGQQGMQLDQQPHGLAQIQAQPGSSSVDIQSGGIGQMQAQPRPSSVNQKHARVQGNGGHIGANMRSVPGENAGLVPPKANTANDMAGNRPHKPRNRPDKPAKISNNLQTPHRPSSTQNSNQAQAIDPQLSNFKVGSFPPHLQQLNSMIPSSPGTGIFKGNMRVSWKEVDERQVAAAMAMGTPDLDRYNGQLYMNGEQVTMGAAQNALPNLTAGQSPRPSFPQVAQNDFPAPQGQQRPAVVSTSRSDALMISGQESRHTASASRLDNNPQWPSREARGVAAPQPKMSSSATVQEARSSNIATSQTGPHDVPSIQQSQNVKKIILNSPIFDQPFILPTTDEGWHAVLTTGPNGQPEPLDPQSLILANGSYELHINDAHFRGGFALQTQHSDHRPSSVLSRSRTRQETAAGAMQGSSNFPKTPTMQGRPSHRQETPSISRLRLEDGTPAGTSRRNSKSRADRYSLPDPSPQVADTHDKTPQDKPTMKRSAPENEDLQDSPSKRQKPLESIAPMGASGSIKADSEPEFAQAVYERPLLKASQLSLPRIPGQRAKRHHEQGREAVSPQRFHPRPSQSLGPFPDFQAQPPHRYAAGMVKVACEALQKECKKLAAANTSSSSARQASFPQAKSQPVQQVQGQPVIEKSVGENTAIREQLREDQSSNLGVASANATDSVENATHDSSSYDYKFYNNGDADVYLYDNSDLDAYFDEMEGTTNAEEATPSAFPVSDVPAGWKNQQTSASPPNLMDDSDASKPTSKSPPEARVYDEEIDDVDISKAVHEAEDESKRRKKMQKSGLAAAPFAGNQFYGMGEEEDLADDLNHGSTTNEAPEEGPDDDLIRSLFGDN